MVSPEINETSETSAKLTRWLEQESLYQWDKFDLGDETRHLLEEGLGDNSYWGSFLGIRWIRFQDANEVSYHLKAAQALAKETACSVAVGVCLRHGLGQSFEQANSQTIDASRTHLDLLTDVEADQMLAVRKFRDTVLFDDIERVNILLHTTSPINLGEAVNIMDLVIGMETKITSRYISNVCGDVFPKPLQPSTSEPEVWVEDGQQNYST